MKETTETPVTAYLTDGTLVEGMRINMIPELGGTFLGVQAGDKFHTVWTVRYCQVHPS